MLTHTHTPSLPCPAFPPQVEALSKGVGPSVGAIDTLVELFDVLEQAIPLPRRPPPSPAKDPLPARRLAGGTPAGVAGPALSPPPPAVRRMWARLPGGDDALGLSPRLSDASVQSPTRMDEDATEEVGSGGNGGQSPEAMTIDSTEAKTLGDELGATESSLRPQPPQPPQPPEPPQPPQPQPSQPRVQSAQEVLEDLHMKIEPGLSDKGCWMLSLLASRISSDCPWARSGGMAFAFARVAKVPAAELLSFLRSANDVITEETEIRWQRVARPAAFEEYLERALEPRPYAPLLAEYARAALAAAGGNARTLAAALTAEEHWLLGYQQQTRERPNAHLVELIRWLLKETPRPQ